MIRRDLHEDMPSQLKSKQFKIQCTCYFCKLRKSNKIPRGKLVDKTKLAPFTRINVDFEFYGFESIRGFTSALAFTCGTSSYPIGIPGKSKTPPLSATRWVISCLRSMNYNVLFIRVDEDGALAKSAEFCELMIEMNIILETTGGGRSENNGIVEVGNRTRANMIRTNLSTLYMMIKSKMPADMDIRLFWCFCYLQAVFTQRRLYNRRLDDTPEFIVLKKRSSVHELVPMGAIMTIINPAKNLLPKLAPGRAKIGHFMGYDNHIKTRYYWCPESPFTVNRASHCVIDDIATLSTLEKGFATLTPQVPPITTATNSPPDNLCPNIVHDSYNAAALH
jgi:hypothetical protein